MSMRISSAVLLVLAATACSKGEPAATAQGGAAATPERTVEDDGKIPCALAGAEEFARDCTVDRIERDGKLGLVVRHPDGGFRRFEVLTDGRGVAVADGAEDAEVSLVGNEIEVVVGEDAYRFPATRKPDTKGNEQAK